MANVCIARLKIERAETHDTLPRITRKRTLTRLTKRLEELVYDGFVISPDDDTIEVEIGFRWNVPFDDLLALSADEHLSIRCLYEEPGTCFMGAWRAEDGNVEQDDCID